MNFITEFSNTFYSQYNVLKKKNINKVYSAISIVLNLILAYIHFPIQAINFIDSKKLH